MQLYRRVKHLFKTRIFLNLSLTNRPLFRTFIGPFDFFKHTKHDANLVVKGKLCEDTEKKTDY